MNVTGINSKIKQNRDYAIKSKTALQICTGINTKLVNRLDELEDTATTFEEWKRMLSEDTILTIIANKELHIMEELLEVLKGQKPTMKYTKAYDQVSHILAMWYCALKYYSDGEMENGLKFQRSAIEHQNGLVKKSSPYMHLLKMYPVEKFPLDNDKEG
jgi:hypothetical protein